ncbi:hypothetical protein RSK60_280016 [Ralstonia solanacearum K60]|nr:hypothetical protein RSK60_280016 [Ralstonia solanacearum K60]
MRASDGEAHGAAVAAGSVPIADHVPGGRTAITEISGANDPSQPLHRMRRHSGLRAVFND